jgi:anti-sigma factor RsiW
MAMTAYDEDLEQLLPWYVNGTLEAADRQKIDEALAHDERLRHALSLAYEDQDAVVKINELVKPPSTALVDRIMEAAAASGRAQQPAIKRSLTEAFKNFLVSLSPRTLAAAAAAVTVVIALQSATIGMIGSKEPRSELASAEPGLAVGYTARFIVGFAAGATAQEIGTLLDGAGLQIVGGPTGGGFYVVEAKLSEANGAEADKILEQLEARRDIFTFSARAPAQEE